MRSLVSKDGNVKIKYDLIEDGNINRPADEIIKKSIVVDLNAPYTELSEVELIFTHGTQDHESYSELIVDLPNDPLVENLKVGL